MRGGTGADTISGGTGNDTIRITSSQVVSGESYDGGADIDTLRIEGGGTVSLAGVTISNMESLVTADTTGTRVVLSTAQANGFSVIAANGTSDTFAVSDLTFLGTFGTPATRASVFNFITNLHTNGVENVEWQEGGATTVATVSGANVVVTSTDNGGNNWTTSTFTFDGTTGARLEKVTNMDDGSVVTRTFGTGPTADTVISDETTGIVGAQDTRTVLYDTAGRIDSVTVLNDNGSSVQTLYDDSNRVDSRTDTAATGFATTTNYNDSNQRTSITYDDTASTLYDWKTSTLTYNPATGQLTEKFTVLDNDNEITESYTAGLLTTRVTEDGGANESFTTATQHFAAGVFQWQSTIYDNGTGFIQGSSAANTISQNNGISDAIVGGGGADVFVFSIGGGADRVLDFSQAQGDKLDLRAFGVDDVSEITSYTQVGANLIMNFGGGDTVQVNAITYAALTNADLVV